ncbi:sigma-54-dependent Fis family transcriptional regulator [Thermosulfurimonas marina]|uniref:DNA-binding transcriptional regulator NtrC n=1 Tax=Thermosulfurimonas marina TaxID=2047767 RepID=A0A6H1WTU2_9BACT|nr:sigma-54 dependent transcriptional regulator [Thermosulfurimonas marina]QJA06536.1 sigma-54-dependent Fis family transcriptional regulator [Thermosulfurimonas marina]
MAKPLILLIDDDRSIPYALPRALQEYRFLTAENGKTGLSRISPEVSVVLLDLKLPDLSGLEVLKRLKEGYPELPVIVITAFADADSAIEAMRAGAYEYVVKPFDTEELRAVLSRALTSREIESGLCLPCQTGLGEGRQFIGKSRAILEVCKLIGQVASSPAPVLITGESGVGKELVARLIHHYSPRKAQPFVALNCAALPETLIEAELFGYERGAFTGADRAHPGKFEQAHGGTLFLDEVGDMSPALQVKLLRVLEEGTVERLGSSRTRRVDVRVLAATNRDLEALVAEGAFREDLYHRLRVLTIHIPPLRERREDIPILAHYFVEKASRELGKRIFLSQAALERLLAYSWPGNVRELENTLTRAAVLARGSLILPEDIQFPEPRTSGGNAAGLLAYELVERLRKECLEGELYERVLATVEKALLSRVLEETGGNQLRAARLLGINRNTLRAKLQKYGLSGN